MQSVGKSLCHHFFFAGQESERQVAAPTYKQFFSGFLL
jgi:hypothetical protein